MSLSAWDHRPMSGGKAAACPRLLWALGGVLACLPTQILSIATKRLRIRPSFSCGENPVESSARSWGLS